MTLVRRFARPLLASTWIYGGAEALRNPAPKVPDASDVALPIAAKIPYLPQDPQQLVKINAAVQLGAGSLLALGKLPRLSALALTGSAVLTTAAGHRFWQERDPQKKAEQTYEFVQNLGMIGGLLIASVDTGGRPSVAWRARRIGKLTGFAARSGTKQAGLATKAAKNSTKLTARAATAAPKAKAASAGPRLRAASAKPKLRVAKAGAKTATVGKLAGGAAKSVRRLAA